MKRLAALVVALLALAACDRPAAPGADGAPGSSAAASGFAHNQTVDLSGYYRPASQAAFGDYRLDHLFLGLEDDFSAWEGGRRSATFGPVMIEISDTRSGANLRALADAYAVSDRSVRFSARHPQLGEIRFEGEIDAGVLAKARRNLGGAEAPALTGDLTIASRTVRDIRFNWWMGD